LAKRYLRTIDENNENYYRLVMEKLEAASAAPAPAKVKSEALPGRAGEIVITHDAERQAHPHRLKNANHHEEKP
jgi:hypothetical protein